jgi:hypothetical protein
MKSYNHYLYPFTLDKSHPFLHLPFIIRVLGSFFKRFSNNELDDVLRTGRHKFSLTLGQKNLKSLSLNPTN